MFFLDGYNGTRQFLSFRNSRIYPLNLLVGSAMVVMLVFAVTVVCLFMLAVPSAVIGFAVYVLRVIHW